MIGSVSRGPQPVGKLEPISSGKAHIEDGKVWCRREDPSRVGVVVEAAHRDSVAAQRSLDRLPYRLLILNERDAGSWFAHPPVSRAVADGSLKNAPIFRVRTGTTVRLTQPGSNDRALTQRSQR